MIPFDDAPRRGKHEAEGHVGCGLRVRPGGIADHDAPFRCGLEVDVVETRSHSSLVGDHVELPAQIGHELFGQSSRHEDFLFHFECLSTGHRAARCIAN